MDEHTSHELAYKRGYEQGKQDAMKWIPVSEPPGKKGCYLVTVKHWCDGKPVTREAYYTGVIWISCEKAIAITERVTHWMPLPLPEPPKGE